MNKLPNDPTSVERFIIIQWESDGTKCHNDGPLSTKSLHCTLLRSSQKILDVNVPPHSIGHSFIKPEPNMAVPHGHPNLIFYTFFLVGVR